jgi:hypothetical protein
VIDFVSGKKRDALALVSPKRQSPGRSGGMAMADLRSREVGNFTPALLEKFDPAITFAPHRYNFGVDPKLFAQLRERSLRSSNCSSDVARGSGAPVTNMPHKLPFIHAKGAHHQTIGSKT